MASDAGVTTTGLAEMRAGVERLPEAVTSALKEVAQRTAEREHTTARQKLRAQQKTAAHALADAIEIVEDLPNKMYLVISKAPAGQPENLPSWNERGTRYMNARPYMRPAEDAVRDQYTKDGDRVSIAVAEQALGK